METVLKTENYYQQIFKIEQKTILFQLRHWEIITQKKVLEKYVGYFSGKRIVSV